MQCAHSDHFAASSVRAWDPRDMGKVEISGTRRRALTVYRWRYLEHFLCPAHIRIDPQWQSQASLPML